MPSRKDLSNYVQYRLPEIRLCLVHENQQESLYAIKTPEDAANLLEPLRLQAEEHFVCLHLNAHHEVIGLHDVSHGTLSATLVHPREVFKAALLSNSHAIIACHNHPSGSAPFPSPEDIETTKQLLEAGKVLGVSLIDHLIVGPLHAVFSIREHHPTLWEDAADTCSP